MFTKTLRWGLGGVLTQEEAQTQIDLEMFPSPLGIGGCSDPHLQNEDFAGVERFHPRWGLGGVLTTAANRSWSCPIRFHPRWGLGGVLTYPILMKALSNRSVSIPVGDWGVF